MIERQDIAALERCFDKIAVQAGDTFLIPGGIPHALGGGGFMIEIQEPTDFSARLEFERAGYLLPEAARFLGRDVDFGISMIDFTPRSLETIERENRCRPRNRHYLGGRSWQEELIGPLQTPCFRVRKTHLNEIVLRQKDGFSIAIVTEGTLAIEAGGMTHTLKTFDRYCIPAGLEKMRLIPSPSATILECFPPETKAV